MFNLFNKLDTIAKFQKVDAHCDIPCGIYDPINAQIAALTVVRMVDLINEHFEKETQKTPEFNNRLARMVSIKDEHAEKVKHEIRVIWGDFLKPEHAEKYPDLLRLPHRIMKLGSEAKQHVNRDLAVELVEEVNNFAQIFWQIKGCETIKANAPYAPSLELVYRKI